MIRNLLYNCCALSRSEDWKENILKICQHQDVFNGRRIILIKEGKGIIDPEIVKNTFTMNAEFFILPNDETLQEGVGFLEALERLESNREDEITFYAHTKGVSRQDFSAATMIAVRQWRDRMYKECLSNVPVVEHILSRYSCAGCFRVGHWIYPMPPNSSWHFSGNYWWVNHAKLFSKPNWKRIGETKWCIEGYLGSIFDIEDSYCFYSRLMPGHNPYSIKAEFSCESCKHTHESWALPTEAFPETCPECGKEESLVVSRVIKTFAGDPDDD